MTGESRVGEVALVGAGPGDPDLLTLKAARAIGAADVILVDDLVHRDILVHARRDGPKPARIVFVGKRGGCVSTPQAFIERLMIAEARRGAKVVRLKGGDPTVFGRSGEEIAALREAGIVVRMIPGVTSAAGAAAELCVSLTHRDHSAGVIFVTGHRRIAALSASQAGASAHNDRHADDVGFWHRLAATQMTLVIYMGLARCDAIVEALLAGGLPRGTPAACVESATLKKARTLTTKVELLASELVAQNMASPAVMIIGDVISGCAAFQARTNAEVERPSRARHQRAADSSAETWR